MGRLACFLVTVLATASTAYAQVPLPNVADLQARALAGYDKAIELRQKYICREKMDSREYDSKGRTKQTESAERETFFVNKFQITQTLSKNGKPLSADELRKRDENVRKAIENAQSGKARSGSQTFSVRDILKYGKLVDERRIEVAGRPTIVFNLAQDPDKGGGVEAKIIHAMEGTVSIDETTGTVQDINAEGKRDVKVGGGLLADVHKGFRVHLVLAPQPPDHVWMVKSVEGKGDARVGLFMYHGADFRMETEGCKVYDVTTAQSGDKVRESPPAKK